MQYFLRYNCSIRNLESLKEICPHFYGLIKVCPMSQVPTNMIVIIIGYKYVLLCEVIVTIISTLLSIWCTDLTMYSTVLLGRFHFSFTLNCHIYFISILFTYERGVTLLIFFSFPFHFSWVKHKLSKFQSLVAFLW